MFIGHDLTKKQQEHKKFLHDELKCRSLPWAHRPKAPPSQSRYSHYFHKCSPVTWWRSCCSAFTWRTWKCRCTRFDWGLWWGSAASRCRRWCSTASWCRQGIRTFCRRTSSHWKSEEMLRSFRMGRNTTKVPNISFSSTIAGSDDALDAFILYQSSRIKTAHAPSNFQGGVNEH